MTQKQFNVAIIGASGYTASELITLIHNHPFIKIKYLIGNSQVNKHISEIYPHLKFKDNLPIISAFESINFDLIDSVFCCLPHGESQKIINNIPNKIKIIDLSADFRLNNLDLYQEFYGDAKQIKLSQKTRKFAYGLSEVYENDIKKSDIIACPGCYPTAILLPLIPLIKDNLIEKKQIIIDAKTGVSGAGRKVAQPYLFCETTDNIIPYNLTKHRHLAEIYEQLDLTAKNIQFTPQIIPAPRGIMAMIYVKSKNRASNLSNFLTSFYQGKKFIKINSSEQIPVLRNVTNSNYCEISIIQSNIPNQLIICSVIDNLTKGSSGQALQNFNLIYDLPEDTGLKQITNYP
jgi:N-acetyl-gamma-glutamyl-phosphate reductase